MQACYDIVDFSVANLIDDEEPESYQWIEDAIETIFNFVGVPMALCRLFEPYVWYEFDYQMRVFYNKLLNIVQNAKIYFQIYCCCQK